MQNPFQPRKPVVVPGGSGGTRGRQIDPELVLDIVAKSIFGPTGTIEDLQVAGLFPDSEDSTLS
jgi:hypothetical protein